MTGNPVDSKVPSVEWTDPDDAPEWSDEMFERADLYIGAKLIRAGRSVGGAARTAVTLRLSPEVVLRFRATGRGWHERVDTALREWLAAHPDFG